MKPIRACRSLPLAAPILFVLLAAGCREGSSGQRSESGSIPSSEENPPHGRTYDYVAFGAADSVTRVAGTLVLQSEIARFPCVVEGTWDLKGVGDPGDVGPQIGTGTFRGEVDEAGKVRIDMNPQMADNNVFLVGEFVGGPRGSIEGEWRLSTIAGEKAGGRFKAVPRAGP